MAELGVRNLDPRIVEALKQLAAKHGGSAEAERYGFAISDAMIFAPRGHQSVVQSIRPTVDSVAGPLPFFSNRLAPIVAR